MGYYLKAKAKEAKNINVGGFIWPFILQETGMGYVLGYGSGKDPASYIYSSGKNGSPVSNDKYKVTATEAKAMALVGRGFLSVQKYVNKQWIEDYPDEADRKAKSEMRGFSGQPLFRSQMGEKTLKVIEDVVEFLEQSKGFTIN